MYKRILLAVDDSDTSVNALHEAVRLQKTTAAVLKVLHVVQKAIDDMSCAPAIYHATSSQYRAAEQLLEKAGNTLAEAGVKHERQISEVIGISVAQEIVRQAEAWSAEIIVMGTHGRHGLGRLLMGSNAESVLRMSPVPVLLTRDRETTAAASAESAYGRMLVPVDGSELALKGLDQALEYSQAIGAQVKVIHILNLLMPDDSAVPSLNREPMLIKLRQKGADVLAAARDRAARRKAAIDTEAIEVVGTNVAYAILSAAQHWNADLIVMATSGRRGMRRLLIGSDAEDVLRSSDVPVLLTRQEEVETPEAGS